MGQWDTQRESLLRRKEESDQSFLKKFKCQGGCFGMLKFRIDRRISLQSQLRDEMSLLVAETKLRVLT